MKKDLGETPVLEREHGAPLYHQIYLILRDAISSGRYRPGDLMPNEDAIAASFGVSRITVRHALDTLARAQLIERRPGRGTFVAQQNRRPPATMPLDSVVENIILVGETTEVQVVEFGYAHPPPDVAEAFGLTPGERLQRAVRVRYRDGLPYMHLTTFVSERLGRKIARADLEKTPLFELIRTSGERVDGGHQTVTATLAAPPVAQRLNLKIGAPLLRIIRILSDAKNRPIEHLDMLCSPERYQLSMVLESDQLRAMSKPARRKKTARPHNGDRQR